jgi:tetratricopeptide (TPR) repeat protein
VAHFDAGRLWQERGELERAAESYEQALRLDRAFSHAANNLGAVYKQLGRYQRGEQVLSAAIAADGQFAGLDYNLGMLLVKARSEQRAVAHLQSALRKAVSPEPPPRWHDDLAAVLEAVHRMPEALEHSAAAVALDPTTVNFARRLGRLRAGGDGGGGPAEQLAAAAELEAAGQANAAYLAYQGLAAARPDDDDMLYRLAWNRFLEKDYYPAHTHLSAALVLDPSNRDYLTFMGVLLHETGNWEEAADYLNDALAISPAAAADGKDTKFENEEFEVRACSPFAVLSSCASRRLRMLVADLVQLGHRAQGSR